jgi:Transmembrane domain of unknown function (DUF3566)
MPADGSGTTTDDQGPYRNGVAGTPAGPGADDTSARSTSSSPVPGPERSVGDDPTVTSVGDDRPAGGELPAGDASGRDGRAGSGDDSRRAGGNGTRGNGGGRTGEPTPGPVTPPGSPFAPVTQTAGPDEGPAHAAGAGPASPLTTPEPPPAPVLLPRPTGIRRFRGRHAPSRAERASRRGLRVNQRLWSIDPWSVFKVSALFYLCTCLIVLVAVTLLYNAGRSVGTIDQVESFITRMGAYGTCTPKAELPKGTEFEEDDDCAEGEVLVGGFALDDGTLFKAVAIGGGILVVAGSIANVLMTVLVNLLNEVTGGLRHTVIREPVARPPRGSTRRHQQR